MGIRPPRAFEFDTSDSLVAMVATGMGVAITTPLLLDSVAMGGRLHVRWDETARATPHGQLALALTRFDPPSLNRTDPVTGEILVTDEVVVRGLRLPNWSF